MAEADSAAAAIGGDDRQKRDVEEEAGPDCTEAASQEQPSSSGNYYCRVVDFADSVCGGRSPALLVWQASVCDVGGVVWDAALALVHWLDTRTGAGSWLPNPGCPVMELGCGTGIVGLKLAQMGYRTRLTDLAECLPLVARNIRANADSLTGEATCHALDWTKLAASSTGGDVQLPHWCPPDGSFLVVCDCLYYEDSVGPLLSAMRRLATASCPGVLFAYESRPDKAAIEVEFFGQCERHFDTVARVPLEDMHPDYRCPEIHIMLMSRKA